MRHHLETSALLSPPRPLTEDEISDLVAVIVDELDELVIEPSVSTVTDDAGNVRFTVTMDVEAADEYRARARGAVAVRDAFKAADMVMEAGAPVMLLTA
jgi:hypothetical protein